MNSLNESNCCRTKPFSSKKAEMTVQASSCFDDNEEHAQKEVSCCDHPPRNTLSRERERERERKNKKEKQRDTFREREPSSRIGLIVVLSFDERERERERRRLSLSLFSHTRTKEYSSDLAIHTTTRGRRNQR